MVNTFKIKGLLKEHNMTQAELAEALEMDASTLNRKLNRQSESFSIRDVKRMMDLFQLAPDDMVEIFFSPTVSKVRREEII